MDEYILSIFKWRQTTEGLAQCGSPVVTQTHSSFLSALRSSTLRLYDTAYSQKRGVVGLSLTIGPKSRSSNATMASCKIYLELRKLPLRFAEASSSPRSSKKAQKVASTTTKPKR